MLHAAKCLNIADSHVECVHTHNLVPLCGKEAHYDLVAFSYSTWLSMLFHTEYTGSICLACYKKVMCLEMQALGRPLGQ